MTAETQAFDVVIVGGGPGGYPCAIRAAQLGLKVACVDSRATWGGTCLNVGCIPSKAMLHSSHEYHKAKHELANQGIMVGKVGLDLAKMQARKDKVVQELTGGIAFLFKKNGVTGFQGTGRVVKAGEVLVTKADGSTQTLAAKSVVIATGSVPANIPNVTVDEKNVLSSTGALTLAAVPKKLAVIGGGYIGLEMGSLWARLGSEVTVIEFADRLVPQMDGEISAKLKQQLEKQGLTFKLATKVTSATTGKNSVSLALEPAAGGKGETLVADKVLVAVGRRPYTSGLGLEELGIALTKGGQIVTDAHYQTNVAGIYAVGDVIAGPMLAHKAEEEGIALAEQLVGQHSHVNYDVIPAVVFTYPEVASVGKTEEELKAAGIVYRAGKFLFSANARAKTTDSADGFVKILADATTDQILGVHIMGAEAGTLIAEAALAMEFKAAAEDLARTCHAHPTTSEAVKEAAWATFSKAIHA
jgi:dihydrolipoamide dehydrogenase